MPPFQLNELTIYQISEKAISISFGEVIDKKILANIRNLNKWILANPFEGFLTTVPAYATLTLFYNPLLVHHNKIFKGLTCFDKIVDYLNQFSFLDVDFDIKTSEIIEIPVCYEDEFGLDLTDLAIYYQLKKEEIIQIHSSALYTVYMIGFVPGFAYLGGMAEILAAPRKPNPRKEVPAGSVGIAGQQTGIYPLNTPGGWQIIGQTPLNLFDVIREQPSLLKAGDQVKFVPISVHDFYAYPKNL
jgi:inhibitor of KinA